MRTSPQAGRFFTLGQGAGLCYNGCGSIHIKDENRWQKTAFGLTSTSQQ
jgi:hypothetical protein